MNYRIFTLLLSILFLNTLTFAQSNAGATGSVSAPLKIDKFKTSFLTVGGKKWIKLESKVTCKVERHNKNNWIKDVKFTLLSEFECTNRDADKRDTVWFSSEAEFYFMENSKYYFINFYVPWDIVEYYGILKYVPSAYVIDISANGVDYPLNAENYKERTSARDNRSIGDLMKRRDAANLSETNGYMLYYDALPFNALDSDGIDQSRLPTIKRKN